MREFTKGVFAALPLKRMRCGLFLSLWQFLTDDMQTWFLSKWNRDSFNQSNRYGIESLLRICMIVYALESVGFAGG